MRIMHLHAGIVGIRDQGITHLPASVASVGAEAKVEYNYKGDGTRRPTAQRTTWLVGVLG